ncbi:MAG: helix-turn-helix domain-containing protein [Candidatus Dormibacteria bacterium]
MADVPTPSLSDVATLKALAHPLRLRILGSLRIDGPATATMLARALSTDTGQTSFHLRKLAEAALVEDATELGKGRERWWRASAGATHWDPVALLRDPESESVLLGFEDAALHVWADSLRHFIDTRREWSEEWINAASSADYQIRLTPAGLTQLVGELHDAVERAELGSSAPASAELVTIQVHAFPRRRR